MGERGPGLPVLSLVPSGFLAVSIHLHKMSPTEQPLKIAVRSIDEHTKPFDRIWRGDKSGTITYYGRPHFEDKYAERQWIKGHLVCGS